MARIKDNKRMSKIMKPSLHFLQKLLLIAMQNFSILFLSVKIFLKVLFWLLKQFFRFHETRILP